MIVLTVLLGILGLGLVVFVHELGHFLAAKACGVTVEVFSLGWGPKLIGVKPGKSDTEYRISAIPLGGYCRMKGEEEFKKALDLKLDSMPKEPGSFHTARWWKRIIIAASGPLANVVFSCVVLGFVWYSGYTVETYGNRIVMAGDLAGHKADSAPMPAEAAGMKSGDRITEIDGHAIEYFFQIRERCSAKPGEQAVFTFERNGEKSQTTITPILDKSTGAGKIGVAPWVDLTLASVVLDSPASRAGLLPGDTIVSANGIPAGNTNDLDKILRDGIPRGVDLGVSRNGTALEIKMPIEYDNDGAIPSGMVWRTLTWRTPKLSVPEAAARGVSETVSTAGLVLKSFTMLFSGIDLTKAVSGPISITMMTGEIAQESFSSGAGQGFALTFNFLALISIALFVMNLLPIPVLDGGQIVICLVEAVFRKPLKPATLLKFQSVGSVIIFSLLIFATFSDIMKWIVP